MSAVTTRAVARTRGRSARRDGPPQDRRRRLTRRDSGQLTVLIIGLFVIVVTLIIGGVDVTAAQIARARLLDASDDAALDAADALDVARAYSDGIGANVTVSDATVRDAAARNLASRPLPNDVTAWDLGSGTGTADGQTATVVLHGQVALPLVGGVLSALGRSVTVTVVSHSRAPLVTP